MAEDQAALGCEQWSAPSSRGVTYTLGGDPGFFLDQQPGPAVLAETVEHSLHVLYTDERSIIELSLQGHTTQEISERLGRAERSVRRLRERVRKQLERLRGGSGPERGAF